MPDLRGTFTGIDPDGDELLVGWINAKAASSLIDIQDAGRKSLTEHGRDGNVF